jgi:hypothetical protein
LLQRLGETTGRIIACGVLRVQVDAKLQCHAPRGRVMFGNDGITSEGACLAPRHMRKPPLVPVSNWAPCNPNRGLQFTPPATRHLEHTHPLRSMHADCARGASRQI